jgi:hypothetical protein
MTYISKKHPRLHGYQTYATHSELAFNENHLENSVQSMPMTFDFAICHFSCPDLVFKELPHQPPDGFLTNGFAMAIISMIFIIITF